jgi:hypothetical protein
MAKGFLGSMAGGFKLGKARPKVQKRFISRKTLGARKNVAGFKKFMGASNKTKGRFLRAKVNANKNVKFAKKFFKVNKRVRNRWIRKKASLIKRKAAEAALEGGKRVLKGAKKAIASKGGFNPLKFVLMVFAGWLVNQLPKIVAGIKKFIEWAKPAFEMLGKWVKGIIDFFKWIGGGVSKLWTAITGSSDSADAEKKALEGKTKELEGTFKKQKEGFNELEKKAKKEEGSLKKDLDDVDKEVKDEVQGDVEGKKTSTSADGKTVASTTGSGKADPVVKTKSTPKTKLVSKSQKIGTGKPVTVVIKGETVILQPGTVEYNAFFKGGGAFDKIVHNKTKDVNLVKSSSGPKIVTVDVPIPTNKTPTQESTVHTPIQRNSDGVNSKEIALHGIDR